MHTIGINGFGRFGLHLLKYWLDRNSDSNYRISYINDDYIDINKAYDLIISDRYINFNKYKVQVFGSYLTILEPNGCKHEIYFTNCNQESIPWLGKPDLFFECSGKYTIAEECSTYLKENTRLVIISATSWSAEKTLVYGYNHNEFNNKLKVVSYGSCTVNAYFPFANWINEKYGVIDSDVNVIHNIQEYMISDNYTLNRKFCTLEKQAKLLMNFVNDNNFIVNYTIVPYTGVSMIDFRFRVKNPATKEILIRDLESVISVGELKDLYGMDESDIGPEVYKCTTFSTVFIKEGIKCINDNIYFQGYFDNENSVNRFYDLSNYISKELLS